MNKVIKLLIIVIILILAVIVCYNILTEYGNRKKKFKDVGPFQQYWLDPFAYHYFTRDLYSIKGQVKLPYDLYTPEYMPYESAIPAVDVLRANNHILPTSYFLQYKSDNTTPYSKE